MTGWEPWAMAAAMWWASGMTAASALYRTHRYDDWRLLGLAAVAGPATFLLFATRPPASRRPGMSPRIDAVATPEANSPVEALDRRREG